MNLVNPYRFAPPLAPSEDALWRHVALSAHCNGSNGSQTLTDVSNAGHVFTARAAAQISTSQSVFGGASAEFDGASQSRFDCPASPCFAFGAGNFTVEFRIRRSATGGAAQVVIGQWQSNNGQNSWLFEIDSGVLNFYYSFTGSNNNGAKAIGTLNVNQWYSVAVVRSGTTIYTFLDGALVTTVTSVTSAFKESTEVLDIGGYHYAGGNDFTGFIDEIRITLADRYTATYTPATAAFPDVGPADPTFLVNQGFEGTGYDNGETWTIPFGSGVVDPDYTTSPIVGSHSLRLSGSASQAVVYTNFSAQDEIYGKIRFRINTLGNGTVVIDCENSGAPLRFFPVSSSGLLSNGSGICTGALPSGLNLYVWWRYKKGTGSNGISAVAWNTVDVAPSFTNGIRGCIDVAGGFTAQVNRLQFGYYSNTYDFVYDKVQVAATAF